MKYLEIEASLASRQAYERSVTLDGTVTTRVHTTKCVIGGELHQVDAHRYRRVDLRTSLLSEFDYS